VKETDKEIIFKGRSISVKHGKLPIKVVLKSKLSKRYFKDFFNKVDNK